MDIKKKGKFSTVYIPSVIYLDDLTLISYISEVIFILNSNVKILIKLDKQLIPRYCSHEYTQCILIIFF
jgi:hypothetical protein